MRRLAAGLAVVVVGATAYGAADVLDAAPGVLTRDDSAAVAQITPGPTPVEAAELTGEATEAAPMPDPHALAAALDPLVAHDWLGPRAGVVVRDALTGEVLYEHRSDVAMVPASTQKVLAGAAIAETSDLSRTMTTKVVRGAQPDEIVLVAAGDTLMAKGAGDPAAVEGRAGMRDLAQQVARSLGPAKGERLTLRLDATYAPGPRMPSTWDPVDAANGFTQRVTMIGMADERPIPYEPSPEYPERSALAALRAELKRAGVTVTVEDSPKTWAQAAPTNGEVLGSVESAPLGEVLAEAMSSSDNALTENLARQAALADGASAGDAQAVADWIKDTLSAAGADMSGVRMRDASGLSGGQAIPAETISEVMQLGITGSAKGLRGVLMGLPVAGLTGTLHDRFDDPAARPAAGVARAKTGTLTGVSGLAGTTVTDDGRILTYVILADRVPPTTGTLGARAALDDIVGTLTSCGCR